MGIICVEGCGKRQGTRVGGGLTPLGHYLTPSSGTLRPGDISYAPLGLGHLLDSTHGLRRGLHSFAASRLGSDTAFPFVLGNRAQKLRNEEAVDDYFDPSYSLTVSDLHLQTSFDLPFARMAKM